MNTENKQGGAKRTIERTCWTVLGVAMALAAGMQMCSALSSLDAPDRNIRIGASVVVGALGAIFFFAANPPAQN
jgi:hypothetical protein